MKLFVMPSLIMTFMGKFSPHTKMGKDGPVWLIGLDSGLVVMFQKQNGLQTWSNLETSSLMA